MATNQNIQHTSCTNIAPGCKKSTMSNWKMHKMKGRKTSCKACIAGIPKSIDSEVKQK